MQTNNRGIVSPGGDRPSLETVDATAAVALAAINRRVGAVYMHDFRGSIQALQGAVELLARLGKFGVTPPDRLEKAAELAKRALTNHAKLMTEMLRRLNGGWLGGGRNGSEPPLAAAPDTPRSYPQLIRDVVFFLRHEAERAGVVLELQTIEDCAAPGADYDQSFVVLTGLMLTALDSAERGALLHIQLAHDASHAWLTLATGTVPIPAADPVLHYGQRFFESIGGSLQLNAGDSGQRLLIARHPLAAPAI